MSKLETNLSQGNVAKQLIRFSLPFLFSNLLQSLYNVADMIIVGQFAGTVSMSGVNIGGQVTFILTNMIMGLAVGGTVLVAQYLGAGERKSLEETISTFFTSLVIAGLTLSVALQFLREPLLHLIQTPAESFSEAADYFSITSAGFIFIFAYNALSAIMRGMGDSKRPLIFVAVACSVNVVLDIYMVRNLGMGAKGAAIATVISQAVSVVMCVAYLKTHNFVFDFKLKSFKINKERLKLLLKIGIPTSIQNTASGVSFLFLSALVNSMGVLASAAVGAAGKLNSFAILPAVAMSSSISTMCAQNIGAGEYGRAVKTLKIGMVCAAVRSFTIFFLIRLFPGEALALFSDDAAMIELGKSYITTMTFDYLLVPWLFCLNGLFTGAGHTTFSLINNSMSSVLVRIPVSYVLGMMMNLGLPGIGAAAPAATGIALVVAIWFYLSGRWKERVILKNGEEEIQLDPELLA